MESVNPSNNVLNDNARDQKSPIKNLVISLCINKRGTRRQRPKFA